MVRGKHHVFFAWWVVWPPNSTAAVKGGFVVQLAALAAGFGH